MKETRESILRDALAEKGIRINADGRLELIPGFTGAGAPTPAKLTYLSDVIEFRRVHSSLTLNWATDFVRTIARLRANSSPDLDAVRAAFFLRLHGILLDIAKPHALAREFLKEGPPTPTSDLHKLSTVLTAIDALRNELTEDELLYAEYRRHAVAHVFQMGYEPQWNKKTDAPKDGYTSKYTDQRYEIRDLDERIKRIIRRYGDEDTIASDFARRLDARARELLKAVEVFCT